MNGLLRIDEKAGNAREELTADPAQRFAAVFQPVVALSNASCRGASGGPHAITKLDYR
jgi:hypothetical protein